jgi:hypothetical protein
MPHSQSRKPGRGRRVPAGGPSPHRQVRETLIRVGLPLLVALLVAVWLPSPLFLPVMEVFSFYAAMGMALSAFWRREEVAEAGRFNRWDSAMILMAASMTFALFVDEAAALAFIEKSIDDSLAH